MFSRRMYSCFFSLLLLFSCGVERETTEHKKQTGEEGGFHPSEYVSPLVGTQSEFLLSNGNTYPAIALPWGMNFWTPQTGKMGDGWAYTYDAKAIRGFKQTHQPSPWINDYGQFALMPMSNGKAVDQESRKSWFSHKTEEVHPYYYKVYLADHDVTTEIAPTERAAILRFTFPESDKSGVVIDAFDNGSFVEVLPDQKTVIGYTTKNSGGVPENFKNWFVIQFDTPFASFQLFKNGDQKIDGEKFAGNHALAFVEFPTKRGQHVNARVASSFISIEQAYQNLKELGDDSLEEIKLKAQKRWDDVLGRIVVKDQDVDKLKTFYSCLYRSTLFPRKFYEINAAGEIIHYSPYNGKIEQGYMFTDTGFWDTFRALFPLLNLIYPSMNEEIQEGLANVAKQNDFLPEWASPGHRDCMVGNNSASVVADAMLKGVNTKELDQLYRAMVHASEYRHPTIKSTGRYGVDYYNELGYVPYNVGIHENVARTLEYAYNDWCIMKMAEALGRPQSEINKFKKRSQNYRNVFDPKVGLMRGKNEDGTFQEPFSPYKWGDAFTEGNSWHYTWSVFHDIQGLIDLMGGEKRFVQMLDSVFVVPPIYDDSYYGFRIHEIVEMQIANMGNYAHGNQPAQHMIYLYNYAGQPWKTQYWVREVLNRLYSAKPDGYCGDEDNGQTSAWYVFSSLGFYPVCPGTDQYVIGAPLFKEAIIKLENGKNITLLAPNNSDKSRYIDAIKIDGKRYDKNYFTYDNLIQGETIEFIMTDKANMKRGVDKDAYPYSFSNEKK